MMIRKDQSSAREYIFNKKKIGLNIRIILGLFDEYTLEAICVYVLSSLFHASGESTVVRASSFIESLSYCIKYNHSISCSKVKAFGETLSMVESVKSSDIEQLKLEDSSNKDKVSTSDKKTDYRRIASCMLDFLQERGEAVQLVDDINIKDTPPVSKKGSYYKGKPVYVQCLFSLSLLPIKTQLPMIVKPLPWSVKKEVRYKYERNPD